MLIYIFLSVVVILNLVIFYIVSQTRMDIRMLMLALALTSNMSTREEYMGNFNATEKKEQGH